MGECIIPKLTMDTVEMIHRVGAILYGCPKRGYQ
jgi:hypothetical protein